MSTVIQTIAVLVILAVMVMILLGIGHIFSGDFQTEEEDMDKLRHDVDRRHDVITNRSMFSSLVEGKSFQSSMKKHEYAVKHRKS